MMRATHALQASLPGSRLGLGLLRDLMKDLAFHELTVVREKWALARAGGWVIAHPELKELQMEQSATMQNTKLPCEGTFNHLRKAESTRQKSNVLSPESIHHATLTAPNVLSGLLRHVQLEERDFSAALPVATRHVPRHMYDAKSHGDVHASINLQLLKDGGAPSWKPPRNDATMRQTGANALLQTTSDYNKAAHAWLACLLGRGHVYLCLDNDKYFVSFGKLGKCAVLGWAMMPVRHDDNGEVSHFNPI